MANGGGDHGSKAKPGSASKPSSEQTKPASDKAAVKSDSAKKK